MTKIKQFILEDGERFCLLVSNMDEILQFYPNLFMISQFRNAFLFLKGCNYPNYESRVTFSRYS